jgi:hypothetical protein
MIGFMTTAEILGELAELDGPRGEDAFFRLLHLERGHLPVLEDAFRRSPSPERRARIIEVLWQLRWPEALGILLEAARDPADPVWKEALNGLVTAGGAAGLDALKTLEREWSRPRPAGDARLEWVREAIAQVEASTRSGDR